MIEYLSQEDLLSFARTYFDESEETLFALGHSNIYVYRQNEVITSYLVIMSGYQITAYLFADKAQAKELLDEVKKRYDELVLACSDNFFEDFAFIHEEADVYAWMSEA